MPDLIAKAWRERQKSLGLCIYCKNLAVPGQVRCESCRQRQNDLHAKRMQSQAGKEWNEKYYREKKLARAQTRLLWTKNPWRKYSLNEAAFDDPESNEEAAYWIGFLMADGCVSAARKGKGQAEIILALSACDEDHIEKFKRFIGASQKTTHGQVLRGNPWARISVSSDRLARQLAKFGVVPRKSLTAKCVGLERDRHFWRGAVDGDGCLGWQKQKRGDPLPFLELVGSHDLVSQFSDFAKKFSLKTNSSVRKNRNIWRFVVAGRHALPITQELYRDCLVSLPRKHKLAREFSQWRYAGGRDWSWLTLEKMLEMKANLGKWQDVATNLKMSPSQLSIHKAKLIRHKSF